jgi:hypothetical protein
VEQMANKEKSVHRLINAIRRKRGLPYVRWSRKMAHYAKSQARYCAKVKKLVHSNKPALKGGENLCCGTGNMSPRGIVRCWMTSKPHREWLLDPRVKTAGVGIVRSKHGTYAAWSFSDESIFNPFNLQFPNFKIQFFSKRKAKVGRGVLRLPVKIILLLASIIVIVLGAHGIWVYFSSLELLFGAPASKLFLTLGVPLKLRPIVEWMSIKGFQSWFIPTAFVVLGIVLWQIQARIAKGNQLNWLNKLHLW